MPSAPKRFRTVALLAFIAVSFGTTAQGKVLAQWVQLGADGNASVRAVTDGACPPVAFDGVATAMTTRSEPRTQFGNVKPALFPVTGCEVSVPRGAVTG